MWWAVLWAATAVCFAAPGKKVDAVVDRPAHRVRQSTQAKEIWSLDYAGEKPVAAFFDAASGAVYVSVQDSNGRGRLDRVSLEGKFEKKGLATSAGVPGPMRAYDGKIYWIVGSSVQIVDPKGARGSIVGDPELTRANQIAVDKDGNVYLIRGNLLVRVDGKKEELVWEGKNLRGLFLYLNELNLLSDGKLVSLVLDPKTGKAKSKEESPFCAECSGLERTSSGKWLTSEHGKVFVDGKPILTLEVDYVGYPAYVFRMNPDEDFFVLPLPDDGKLVAYRMPVIAKPKKTDK
jgi:hypothetical protein